MDLCIDIETAAHPDAAQYLPPATPRKGTKDPDKQAAQIEEKEAALLAGAALDPDLCRIVCLGWDDGISGASLTCRDEGEERAALVSFWTIWTNRLEGIAPRIVGYNVKAFDIPILFRRSLALGVRPSLTTSATHRYRMDIVVDLLEVLSGGNPAHWRSLGFYLKRYGLAPEDPISGAQIPDLVEAGDWDAIRAHNAADLSATIALAKWAGEWRGAV